MKKTLLIAASVAAMALVAPQAFAQAKNFEGFSVGLNYSSVRTDLATVSPTANASSGVTDGYANLQAKYTFAVSDNVVLGIGGTYGLNSFKVGAWPSSENFAKGYYTVDLTPGYAVSAVTLVYGKLTYFGATGYSPTGTTDRSGDGTGYGIGVRQLLTSKVYVQAEYTRNKANEITAGTTVQNGTSNVLSLGVGYQF